uniref:Uncharacterized protein n=1 Tax=Magallana gigas TaxID=29159 RepID=A0A8W8JFZ1_MAGGI
MNKGQSHSQGTGQSTGKEDASDQYTTANGHLVENKAAVELFKVKADSKVVYQNTEIGQCRIREKAMFVEMSKRTCMLEINYLYKDIVKHPTRKARKVKPVDKMKDCPIGYHSTNCSELCSFPSFGYDCQDSYTQNITDLTNPSTEKVKGTTPRVTGITYQGTSLVIHGLPLIVTYTVVVFIGLFIVLCGVFVGIHFYKHCVKHSATADHSFKQQDGYDNLEMDAQPQIAHSSDPTYLDPLSDPKPQYDEIT